MDKLWCILIGYPFGCVLTASLVAKYHAARDVKAIGTGNPGAANIAGQLGVKWGLVSLAGDALKTAIPCLLCGYLLFPGTQAAVLYAGLGVMLGHMYPAWRGFCGGLGVACLGAAVLLYSPLWGAAALLAGLLLMLLTGYADVAAVGIPLVFMVPMLTKGLAVFLPALLIALLMLVRHTPALLNIARGKGQKTSLAAKRKEKAKRE